MPSASSYINRVRVSTEARNVKIQYPGHVGNLTQTLLPITCNIPTSRWRSIQYAEICGNACVHKPVPPCPIIESRYDSGEATGVIDPCSILDGQGNYINTPDGTVVLDAGEECLP